MSAVISSRTAWKSPVNSWFPSEKAMFFLNWSPEFWVACLIPPWHKKQHETRFLLERTVFVDYLSDHCDNASTQITNTEISVFIAVLVIEGYVLFINWKDHRSCSKVGYFLRKWQISWIHYCKITNRIRNFQNTFETPKRSFISAFSIYMTVSVK